MSVPDFQSITYSVPLAKALGLTEAILVAYLSAWGAAKPEQWAYRSHVAIEEDTGIGRQAQRTARSRLVRAGALVEERRGWPAVVHYHLNQSVIDRLCAPKPAGCQQPAGQLVGTNQQHGWNQPTEAATVGWNQPTDWLLATNSVVASNQLYKEENYGNKFTEKEHPQTPVAPVEPSAPAEPEREPAEKPEYSESFLAFWAAYPKKRDKDAAWRWWKRARPSKPTLAAMLAAIERQKRSEEWRKDAGRFIKNPATWLNAGGWKDELDEPPTALGPPKSERDQLTARLARIENPSLWTETMQQRYRSARSLEEDRNRVIQRLKQLGGSP